MMKNICDDEICIAVAERPCLDCTKCVLFLETGYLFIDWDNCGVRRYQNRKSSQFTWKT